MPSWIFELDEVSTGVYEVMGKDEYGHCVSAKGTDLDELIQMCRADANNLSK